MSETPTPEEHVRHMTDGHWHDDCRFCLQRREKGGTGLEGTYVPVTEMYVNCSFPMRPDVIAASDTCRHSADSAVVMENGDLMWRCLDHGSMRKPGEQGEARYYVAAPKPAAGPVTVKEA